MLNVLMRLNLSFMTPRCGFPTTKPGQGMDRDRLQVLLLQLDFLSMSGILIQQLYVPEPTNHKIQSAATQAVSKLACS